MANNLKAKFEKLAADQLKDPNVTEIVTEKPKPGICSLYLYFNNQSS